MAILLSSWALLGAKGVEVSASDPRRRLRLLALGSVSGAGPTCAGLVEAPTEEAAAAADADTDADRPTCTKDARRRPGRHRRRFRVAMVPVQFNNNVGDTRVGIVANSNAVVACCMPSARHRAHRHDETSIIADDRVGGKLRFRCSGRLCQNLGHSQKSKVRLAVFPPTRPRFRGSHFKEMTFSKIACIEPNRQSNRRPQHLPFSWYYFALQLAARFLSESFWRASVCADPYRYYVVESKSELTRHPSDSLLIVPNGLRIENRKFHPPLH